MLSKAKTLLESGLGPLAYKLKNQDEKILLENFDLSDNRRKNGGGRL